MSKRKAAIALGVAGLGLVVYGATRRVPVPRGRRVARRRKLPAPTTKQGAVVCPAALGRVPASTVGAKPGDFVALRLADHAGTFTEIVWAIILTIHGKGAKLPWGASSTAMQVRLTGTIGTTSVAVPQTARHGFDIGDTLVLEDNCAWEVFHGNSKGMALCGLFGRKVSDTGTPAAAGALVAGEEVLIYLAPVKKGSVLTPGPGWDVPNPVWARVVRVSQTKSVLQVRLLDVPAPMPGMTLKKGTRIDINRDCVYGVRPGGAG